MQAITRNRESSLCSIYSSASSPKRSIVEPNSIVTCHKKMSHCTHYYVCIYGTEVLTTCSGWMTPGHQAMPGSRIPPSHVVDFPPRKRPAEPPVVGSQTWPGRDLHTSGLLSGPLSEEKKTKVLFSSRKEYIKQYSTHQDMMRVEHTVWYVPSNGHRLCQLTGIPIYCESHCLFWNMQTGKGQRAKTV